MTQAETAMLKRALNYDLSELKNYFLKQFPHYDLHCEILLDQYRKFMFLKAITKKQLCVPYEELDYVWHAHILLTKSYHAYCKYINGNYLHHQPFLNADRAKRRLLAHNLLLASQTYFGQHIFGPSGVSYLR